MHKFIFKKGIGIIFAVNSVAESLEDLSSFVVVEIQAPDVFVWRFIVIGSCFDLEAEFNKPQGLSFLHVHRISQYYIKRIFIQLLDFQLSQVVLRMINDRNFSVMILKIFFISFSVLHLVLVLNWIVVEFDVVPEDFAHGLVYEIETKHLRVTKPLIQNMIWETLAVWPKSIDKGQRDHQEL